MAESQKKRFDSNPLKTKFEGSVPGLEDAVISGDLEQIAAHLAAGISPNSRTPLFGDLVYTAVFEQQLGSLGALLTAGGSPDATDAHDNSALSRAAGRGRIDIVQMLFAHGVQLTQQDDQPFNYPAVVAAFSGQASMLRFLFERGVPVDGVDHNGRTPLMTAARLGHTDCVHVCLSFGADINVQDDPEGSTAAMLALYSFSYSESDTMSALCEHGFDTSCMTHLGQTVADIANRNPTSPGALIFFAWRLALAESETLACTLNAPAPPSMRPARM